MIALNIIITLLSTSSMQNFLPEIIQEYVNHTHPDPFFAHFPPHTNQFTERGTDFPHTNQFTERLPHTNQFTAHFPDIYTAILNYLPPNITEELYKIYKIQNITELYEIIDVEKYILITHASLVSIILLLCIICSVVISSPKNTNTNTNDNFPDDFEDYEAYDDKYLKVFRKLKSHILTSDEIESIKTEHILEETPTGTVIMYYDFETKSFNYYCQNKNSIPYLHLESVAQRFTVENDCKTLFIDPNPDPPSSSSESESESEPESEPESPNKPVNKPVDNPINKSVDKPANKSVDKPVNNPIDKNVVWGQDPIPIIEQSIFGTFKSYNNRAPSTPSETSFEAKDKLKKLANHFKYLGKLDNFTQNSILLPPSPPNRSNRLSQEDPTNEDNDFVKIEKTAPSPKLQPRDNLSFAEYKKQILEKTPPAE